MPKLSKRDIEMLKLTCQMELSLVADRLNMKVSAVHSRYDWLRRKRVESQKFVNTINALEKMCPQLRKLLTPSTLAKDYVEVAENV